MAEWSVRLGNNGRLIMNVQETNQIRDLTDEELLAVAGGLDIGEGINRAVKAAQWLAVGIATAIVVAGTPRCE